VRARDDELHQDESPLAGLRDRIIAPDALAEGPVRFLLISGSRDDETWGLIGAFWLSIDGNRGGFLVAPESIWPGSEMVRNLRSGLAERGRDALVGIGDLCGRVGQGKFREDERH